MFSGSYLMLILVTLAIGGFASWRVNSALKRYSRVPISNGLTGSQAAEQMLSYYGIQGVRVLRGGPGQDYFDPRSNTVTLSTSVYDSRSITATATACHEVGHAYQFAQGYMPMKMRSALVPVVNLASNSWMFLLLMGIMLNIAGFVDLAIILYSFAVLFQIVTLPVEFDASRRAMTYMAATNIPQVEQAGSWKVLRACAFTYVAAALTSILQLLWLLGQRQD